jgi:hypothetical protein
MKAIMQIFKNTLQVFRFSNRIPEVAAPVTILAHNNETRVTVSPTIKPRKYIPPTKTVARVPALSKPILGLNMPKSGFKVVAWPKTLADLKLLCPELMAQLWKETREQAILERNKVGLSEAVVKYRYEEETKRLVNLIASIAGTQAGVDFVEALYCPPGELASRATVFKSRYLKTFENFFSSAGTVYQAGKEIKETPVITAKFKQTITARKDSHEPFYLSRQDYIDSLAQP